MLYMHISPNRTKVAFKCINSIPLRLPNAGTYYIIS